MTYDLSRHPFFSPWRDPVSGVTSYVLTRRVAPFQQTFYYVNASVSADEEWLWFYTAFPPTRMKTLGVVSLNPDRPGIHHFPQAGHDNSSPLVAPEGDAVYYCHAGSVWKMGLDGTPKAVCTLDPDYVARREVRRLATHLTRSSDGAYFLLDGQVGNHWFVALGDPRSGKVTVLQEFAANHNHGQFSPNNPELFMLAHDHYKDPVTGHFIHHLQRIFIMDIHGKRYECLTPKRLCRPYHGACHEWWMADGRVGFIDYDTGVWSVDPATGETAHLWKEPLCHAHSDSSGRFLCADQSPYFWKDKPCEVKFLDTRSGRITLICSGLPQPPSYGGWYHMDPHPQFTPRGSWVAYTTTALGGIDVALTPVKELSGE